MNRLRAMKHEHDTWVTRALDSQLKGESLGAILLDDTEGEAVRRSAVVFVHGLFSSSQTWKPLRDLLLRDQDFDEVALLPFHYPTLNFRLKPLNACGCRRCGAGSTIS